MRILYVITELDPGGAERVLFDLCSNLTECEITVLALDGSGEYSTRLRDIGIEVVDLGVKTIKSFFTALLRLRKYLKQNHFDIVHSHLFHANVLARFASIGITKNIISTCHITERRRVLWRHILDRLSARFNLREICVSDAVENFQKRVTGLPDSYFKTIYNCIDLDVFYPLSPQEKRLERRRLGISDDKIVVGFLGRYDYQKGADLYLKAVELLPQKGRAQFLMAGYGSLENELKSQAADDINFMGYQPQPEIFLCCLDICIVPSRWEGFGLVAVEAMACGCALIAAKVDSLPEFVVHEVNGLLFEPENPQRLAGAMCELFNAPDLFANIVKNGIESSKKYSVKKMAQEHLALYREVLEQS